MPTETNGVIAVSALGRPVNAQPGRKSYYSNYGVEQTDVSAPGGDSRVTNPAAGTPSDEILAPMPLALAQASGQLNPDGTPKSPFVVADCHTGTCAYYQYLQGTSMASPHAVGVAALAVAQYGKRDKPNGGLTLARTAWSSCCAAPRPRRRARPRPTHDLPRAAVHGDVRGHAAAQRVLRRRRRLRVGHHRAADVHITDTPRCRADHKIPCNAA